MKKFVMMFAILVALNGCASQQGGSATSGDPPQIRVLLYEGRGGITVTSDAGFTVESGGIRILEATGPSTARVTVRGTSLEFSAEPDGAVAAAEGEGVIVPAPNSVLSFDGVPYAGVVRVQLEGGDLMALNVLSLETYLEGVVPHEIGDPGADGYDAVKTQAVAARTYAYTKLKTRADEPFDVYASVMDQVYRGKSGNKKVTSSAVRDTRGRVLEYKGNTVRAYYSACCGGHTSDINLMWPDREAAAYLLGVADREGTDSAAFCREYKKFRWRFSFSGIELGETIRYTLPNRYGVDPDSIGALVDITVESRSPSGRVTRLSIETTLNDFIVEGDATRWILMPDVAAGRILPSAMFRLDKTFEMDKVAFVSIVGGGNGHGVGMCQNGAIAMARKGYTYTMILQHYYPGCVVGKVY